MIFSQPLQDVIKQLEVQHEKEKQGLYNFMYLLLIDKVSP